MDEKSSYKYSIVRYFTKINQMFWIDTWCFYTDAVEREYLTEYLEIATSTIDWTFSILDSKKAIPLCSLTVSRKKDELLRLFST